MNKVDVCRNYNCWIYFQQLGMEGTILVNSYDPFPNKPDRPQYNDLRPLNESSEFDMSTATNRLLHCMIFCIYSISYLLQYKNLFFLNKCTS
jgi:hypothetical protein